MALTKDFFKRAPKKAESAAKVTVFFDVGFPNSLFIRGSGCGLSWEKGIPLKNISRDTWVFEPKEGFTSCEFKILINDQNFELGDNHPLKPGDSIEYTPSFW